MKYELIELYVINTTTNKNVALIKRGITYPEYAVVRDLDLNKPMESDEQWGLTIDAWNPIISNLSNIECLQRAIELFRQKTEENYISRWRLEELATLFKDGLIEDDEFEAYHYFDEECNMQKHEFEFFGMECNDED